MAISLRRNSSGTWLAASSNTSINHATKIDIWIKLTTLHEPGGGCGIGLERFIGTAAPAEAAAQEQLVHVALSDRQAGRFRRRRQRGFGVLRARPHLALVGRVQHGGVERLHAGMRLVAVGVDRLDLLGRACDRRL